MAKEQNSKIWLSPPHMNGAEMEFIEAAFDSNYIAPIGSNIDGFENDLENYLGNNFYAVATNSGTAAIHLALKILGIKQEDEILCQSNTFVASVNPISYLGAKPIFIDSEKESWNLSPELLEIAIKDRISKGKTPKAIIAVSLYGMPFKFKEVHKIAENYKIPLIEDSAEALGSNYFDTKCGTMGDYSIFSFNGNKIITTSAGGALICRNSNDKNKAIYLANQAKENGVEYTHNAIGYNYRMSNILAGIGRGQLKSIDKYVSLRRRNFSFYKESLKFIPDIKFQEEPNGFYSNRWLTCILFDSQKTRDNIANLLNTNNIESRPSWKPMHLQPIYKDCLSFLNGTSEELYHKGLCLPSGSNLNEEDLNRITKIIKSYF